MVSQHSSSIVNIIIVKHAINNLLNTYFVPNTILVAEDKQRGQSSCAHGIYFQKREGKP